jgi:hypothetical protein
MNYSNTLNKILKNLLAPFLCFLTSITLYFIFISPYFSYLGNFDSMKSGYENSIKTLSNNLSILDKVSQNLSKLEKMDTALKSLVPDSANPSDLVGLIDKTSTDFRFGSVEENRNISSSENDKNQLIQVSFNGKSPGIVSSVSFIKSLLNSELKLIKITQLQLTNNPEELHTRVSFNAFSVFAPPLPAYTSETPLDDFFVDSNFNEFLNSF